MSKEAANIVAKLASITERRKRASLVLDEARELHTRLVQEENEAISAFMNCLKLHDVKDSLNYGHDTRLVNFWSSVVLELMRTERRKRASLVLDEARELHTRLVQEENEAISAVYELPQVT